MYEPAIAHRYNAAPVFDVARILEFELWQERTSEVREDGRVGDDRAGDDGDEKIDGRGPIVAFVGDSCMTVDPVLAQGFTMAMEAGGSIADSVERSLVRTREDDDDDAADDDDNDNNNLSLLSSSTCPVYDPRLLRGELLRRKHNRERRLLQLLRSTELVQLMAQPSGLTGSVLATWFVRPIVMLCPDFVKRSVFDYMIKYSLGLPGDGDRK